MVFITQIKLLREAPFKVSGGTLTWVINHLKDESQMTVA